MGNGSEKCSGFGSGSNLEPTCTHHTTVVNCVPSYCYFTLDHRQCLIMCSLFFEDLAASFLLWTCDDSGLKFVSPEDVCAKGGGAYNWTKKVVAEGAAVYCTLNLI